MKGRVDVAWVDQQLALLNLRWAPGEKGRWALLEPTPTFYGSLGTGNEDDLQLAADIVGKHLGLRLMPSICYEWGLKMEPGIAGEIRRTRGRPRSGIRIPLFYVGKPRALGGILAHELTHEFLAFEGQPCADRGESERFADLVSIALGLGKLVLNGTIAEVTSSAVELRDLIGYLSPELKAYAYRRVNAAHSVPNRVAGSNLCEDARRMLASSPDGFPVGGH